RTGRCLRPISNTMGAYANWFWGLNVAKREEGATRKQRVSIDPDRTLLIADFQPPLEGLANYFPSPPRVMVLPALPESFTPGISYFRFRTATNPIQWDDGVDEAIRDGIDTVAFFMPAREVRGQSLLRLRRLGVRRVLLFDRTGLRHVSPLRVALAKKLTTFGARLLTKVCMVPNATMSEEQCRATLHRAAPRRMVPSGTDRLRIAHFVTALNSGGAERQACYAAIGQKAQDHRARVLTRLALVGADAHYVPFLDRH